jgi:hypothetical protein
MPIELKKQGEPLRFQYSDDVVFLIKPNATAYDIWQMRHVGIMGEDGAVKIRRGELAELVISNFIIGWEGVNIDGKPAPYSWELFTRAFPRNNKRDVFLELENFVLEKTDIVVTDVASKKD